MRTQWNKAILMLVHKRFSLDIVFVTANREEQTDEEQTCNKVHNRKLQTDGEGK